MPREPQTNSFRKRKRRKIFTAADSTPIQARIPKAMFLEIERAARHQLISIADFVRVAAFSFGIRIFEVKGNVAASRYQL